MINHFKGAYAWLSNFYPVEVYYGGEKFASVEHAYQAAKTLDKGWWEVIKDCKTAAEAKKAGKKVPIRPDWDNVKLEIMDALVYQKFEENKELKDKLLATGTEELVEGNWWGDTFWGICKGKGENHLGKILMKIREELR